MSNSLTDRIVGVSFSHDRSVITGTLRTVRYAEAMTRMTRSLLYMPAGFLSSISGRLLRGFVIASGTEWRRWQHLGQRSGTLRRAIFARIFSRFARGRQSFNRRI
jgi:hypothetical protein